jgi:hypothetical protein
VAARVLEQFYAELMGTIWEHSDVQEFVALREQSVELKRRATPTMR